MASTESVSSPIGKQASPEHGLALLARANQAAERERREATRASGSVAPGRVSDALPIQGGLAPVPRSWQSYATSLVVHCAVLALLLAISFPTIRQIARPQDRFVLLAPPIQPYKPKLITPPHVKVTIPLVRKIVIPEPVVKPRELKAVIPPPPTIKEITPTPILHPPQPKIEALAPAPAPKPQVRTGVFMNQELAKGPPAPKQITTGGFGDPQGVPANSQKTSSLTMAKLGGFDLPNGEAKGGAGGRAVVGQTSFGNLGDPNGAPNGAPRGGVVKSSGFGDGAGGAGTGGKGNQTGSVRSSGFRDAAVASPAASQPAAAAQPVNTSAEILFKPKPVYTQEARDLKLEGQVSLEVVFEASGVVRIVRVLHGLGHGLDEAAEQAAKQIRFRPATRAGVAVDANATLYITFQLT